MGNIKIGGAPAESYTDQDITDWLGSGNGGYKHRIGTTGIWVAILRVFDDVGPPMTVRQMFYRLVSVGALPKMEKSYRKVAYHLLKMRRQGVLPYDFISDNTRWMRKPKTYDSVDQMLESAAASYRRSLWTDQKNYVEVWVEKDALAGVFSEVTTEYDVPLMVTRGFPSETFQHEASEVIKGKQERGQVCNLFYFGDYDPSGLAIGESIDKRLLAFGVDTVFQRVAVTREQIETMGLETRPTKKSDSRAKGFLGGSVELDAIHPNVLRTMVREAIESVLDQHKLRAVREAERLERESLMAIVSNGLFDQ